MSSTPLCRAADSTLLIVDVQTRMVAAMPEAARTQLLRGCGLLLQGATLLEVPVIATEQYPQGLGATVPELLAHLPQQAPRLAKTRFSCCGAPGIDPHLAPDSRRQFVLAGLETHICVLQTALELHTRGFQVFVPEDAVCSRKDANTRNALDRLRQAGVIVTNVESVLFEWAGDASHPRFKAISALVR